MTIAQLLAIGLDHAAIWRRVHEGTLHRRCRGVYAVGHAGLSREGEWLAAAFAAEGAMSRLSATELWQLGRHRSSLIAVVTTSRRRLNGVDVHRANHLDPRDITRHRNIPVTTVARTLVDLTDTYTAHQLTNVIYEAAFRHRFSLPATEQAMQRANGRHNLHVLHRAIALYQAGSAGTRSRLEDTFLSLLQSAGIAEPLVNTHVEGEEVDAYWPDRRLVVEVDGPGHARPAAQRDDAQRDRKLRQAGYKVLRFTDDDVERHPDHLRASLSQAVNDEFTAR